MTLFLILLFIFLIFEGISRTEIKVCCCIADCKNKTEWSSAYWLSACLFTASLHPFVCEEHYDFFSDLAEEGEVKLGERIEKK